MAETVQTVTAYEESARRKARSALLAVTAVSIVLAVLILAFPPGFYPALAVAVVGLMVATWFWPVIGVAVVLGLTLLFEQYDFATFTPITRTVPFFENAANFTGIEGFVVTPLEILLVCVAAVVLVQAVGKVRPMRENPLALPVFLFTAALAIWFLYGVVSGGDVKIALWEIRALAYLCLLVFVVPQVVATPRDVSVLLWVAILMVGVKAAQGAWNYFVVLGGDMAGERSVTGHEDALFMAWVMVFLVALLTYRTGRGQKVALAVLTPLMLATFVVTDRRAAYAALAVGLGTAAVLIATDRSRRVRIVKAAVPLFVAGVFVIMAGWNASGPLGMPAETLRSIIAPENQEDIDSSYYRAAEEINLIHAIESEPIVGLGFGLPFQSSGQGGIVDVGFTLENYIAHNEIVWIWAKMGTVGFAIFWVMFGSIIVFGCVAARTLRDPYLRAVAILVTCAVVMQIVVSYVDLQLTYARNMVFLGVLIGILCRLPALDLARTAAGKRLVPGGARKAGEMRGDSGSV